MLSRLYIIILYLLPKSIITHIFGYFARWRPPGPIKMLILNIFSKMYRIDLNEAELDLKSYNSLNDFFIRPLKKGIRPVNKEKNAIVSPVDGKVLNFGIIKSGNILQVKGNEISVKDILGSDQYHKKFLGGLWITIYLAPKDYHRIHSPVSGDIVGYSYVAGRLMPVNSLAVNGVRSLFSKNERLTSYLRTSFGLVALSKIGATIVGSIRVNYDDQITTNRCLSSSKTYYYKKSIPIEKGAEIGRFEMGSTVILFIENKKANWAKLREQQVIKYGEVIGRFK